MKEGRRTTAFYPFFKVAHICFGAGGETRFWQALRLLKSTLESLQTG